MYPNESTWKNIISIITKKNMLIKQLQSLKNTYKNDQKTINLYNILVIRKQINCLKKMESTYSKTELNIVNTLKSFTDN